MDQRIQNIQSAIEPLRQRLLQHRVYGQINTLKTLNIFMEHHVYAVWDFMSLLKSLQQQLTCTTVPWIPKGDPVARKLVNEIVLGEETDVDRHGQIKSHYEMYLEAMQRSGANTSIITELLTLTQFMDIFTSLDETVLPGNVKQFLKNTFEIIDSGEPHKIAAAFTFGREDLIPDMFSEIVKKLNKNQDYDLDDMEYYMQRHIELDGDEHGPMALQMISALCGNDDQKWKDCEEVAKEVLEHRIILWDGIMDEIKSISKKSLFSFSK
ncbi:DUF3050 domain-containing protein [Limibacter armeniacum]|uniref:DUF3050 domain-containing protein n=1 Tax=Limibacter armeniacum TaxID=466084 RepID=UPI002FE61321